jgi:uroporphyrinogen III methyltransferase/synthase
VRLKGGDPFLFGRGGEELELLVENNIPYEIVPGVSSAFAVPAYNGIPVTHRDFTSSVHIITGHRRSSADADSVGIDYEALVRTGGTLIFLMGLSTLPVIMRGLLNAGISPEIPAAVLERGTTAGQRRVLATVSTLEEETERARIKAPAIIVVGEVCRLAESFSWVEKLPLAGRKVLLTRPKELISGMAGRLRKMGAEVLEMPAIETVPIEPNPLLEDCFTDGFDDCIKKDPVGSCDPRKTPGKIDWMVFTSPSGVRIFMDWFLSDHDIRALAGIRFAVIGEGSAKKLRQYGIRPDFLPTVYDGETLGRELAQKIRPERENSSGIPAAVRVLIPRAAIGSRELVEELKKAGDIDILDIPTYTTEYVTEGIVDARGQIENGEIHYAVFTSASTVRGFSAVMKDADLSGIKAICIGRQTRAAAETLGMETRMAEKATLDALLDAVVQCAAEDRK